MRKKLLLCIAALFMISMFTLPASAADEQWTSYENERFGYSVDFPDIFTDIKEPDNGDGVWLSAEDDTYALTLSGGYNVLEENGESRLQSRLEEIAHIVPGSDESELGWYRVIYSDDGGRDGNERLFHEYGIIDKENWASFILVYPIEEQERFASLATSMEKTLKLPPTKGDSAKELKTDTFVLKDGRVFRDGTFLECEVYEAPAGLENGIERWTVIGMDTSDAVTEEETGVWFFGAEGKFMAFIPLESAYEYQDLLWSPAGDRLILVRGSGMRPDMFYELYAEGMDKKAEFSGMRGQIEWLQDGMRFVFTRIDDIREGGEEPGVGYGWKLSAILYDSALEETIPLKESTDTKNFSFVSVSEDGENIMISETSVKSTKDWGNEDKIVEREIKVPVPAAG